MTTAGQEGRGAGGQNVPRESLLPPDCPTARLSCNRCGFAVSSRALGCKNPCRNCGTVYPLGDCSD